MSRGRFEDVVLPHADAAYNLARWLTKDDHDADDVTQDAMLRAYRFYPGLRGEARPWLLAIVRNVCWTWLQSKRPTELAVIDEIEADTPGPEVLLAREVDRKALNDAIASLPVAFREAIILRELEDLSYKQIAHITDVPIGTVMSRLARARRMLAEKLTEALPAPRLRLHK